jgi:hypothetical protein
MIGVYHHFTEYTTMSAFKAMPNDRLLLMQYFFIFILQEKSKVAPYTKNSETAFL